jgi:MFS family permease
MRQEQTAGLRWYQNTTRGQWLALAAALLGWMFDGFEMGIFPLVARPALIELLGLGALHERETNTSDPTDHKEARKQVDQVVGPWNSRITAAFLLGAAAGGWVFGWLGDWIGRVRAMSFSVLTYSLFTGLCGLAGDVYQLAGLRFLAALGMGGEWALGVALVMESWAPHARPVLAGLIGAAANVGFVCAALLVMALGWFGLRVELGGWRWVLGACAFPAVLTFFLRLCVPESERWHHAVQTGGRARLLDIFTPQLRRRTIMGAILAGIALIVTWALVQWIALWVSSMTDSQQTTSVAQLCGGIGAVIGAFLGAVIGQHAPRRQTYFALCVSSFVACVCLFYVHPRLSNDVDVTFLALTVLVGALTASFYGWLPLYLPELFPTRVRATGQGFGYNAGRVIAAAGALSMGQLMQGVFAGSYSQAGTTIALVYVAGMVLVWLAPETHGQPLPE